MASALAHRWRFPGASIAATAWIEAVGAIELAVGARVRDGSEIVVPQGCRLRVGREARIDRQVTLHAGAHMEIADGASVQDRCTLLGDVRIGRSTLFAPNVYASSGQHWFDVVPAAEIRTQDRMVLERGGPGVVAPIVVGEDCWIGTNAVISRGVVIGRGAVVGANSVVTHDVAPYTVVAGAPARVLRRRLAFEPSRRIDSRMPGDYPYFYAGFKPLGADLVAEDGRVASDDFSLCLDTTGATTLRLRVRSDRPVPIPLMLAGHAVHVGNEWQHHEFPIVATQEGLQHFTTTNAAGSRLFVQSAEVF